MDWASGPLKIMKHGLSLLLVLLLGCTSLTPERVNTIAAIAGQAAAVGAGDWLAKHPTHRDAFRLVIGQLSDVLRTDNKDPQSLENAAVELLSSLPTDALKGKDGELYVTPRSTNSIAGEGGLVVWDKALNKSTVVKGQATVPVIKATLSGLKRAMVPKPPPLVPVVPAPPGARVRGAADLEGREAEGPGPAAAPPTPTLWVTNAHRVVYSLVNVDTNGVLWVKWVQTPGSLYHIEQGTVAGHGTNWQRLGSVSNASGTGPTNWVTAWPAVKPPGAWRVVRVR